MMLSAGHPDAQDSIAPGVPAAARSGTGAAPEGHRVPAALLDPGVGDHPGHRFGGDCLHACGRQPARWSSISPDRPTASRDARTLAGAFQPQVRDEHIVIPASMLRAGANEVRLSFASSNLALNRNPEFMHTLFVPARARLAFPCFDQPDLKARFTLTLDVPEGWRAVTNAAEQAREARGTTTTIRFGETPPVSTYLFAFAAGRFQAETAERSGRQFTMLHRETDAAKVARNREAIFDLHASAIEWLERYTGIPYPFAQVRLRPDPVLPVRRHGASGLDLLQRLVAVARSLGDDQPEARTRQPDRPRDRAHVVRRSRHHAVVRRRVDEGGVRELHGGEDRQSDVPGDQSRAALPLLALPRRLRRRPNRGHQRDPPAARQPERSRHRSTARSFTRRRRS